MSTTRPPRGRPRTAANTALIGALIAKQDAMSRRTWRTIRGILDTHVAADEVAIVWRHVCRQVRARLEALPGRLAARRTEFTDPATVERILAEEVRAALTDLAEGRHEGPWPTLPPEETPPTVRRSRTLAAARAQGAGLQAVLIDLKERIVPYQGRPRTPHAARGGTRPTRRKVRR